MKKCEAIAALIEGSIGKPCGRIPPKSAPRASRTVAPPAEAEPVAGELAQGNAQAATEPVVEAQAKAESDGAEKVETPAADQAEPSKPRGGRQERSLAEEMFAEMMGSGPEPSARPEPKAEKPAEPVAESHTPITQPASQAPVGPPQPAPTPAPSAERGVPTSIIESINEVTVEEPVAASTAFEPNPFLPKPARGRSPVAMRVLVLFSLLAALLLVGMAVTAPLRTPETKSVPINVATLTDNPQVIRRHYTAVTEYRSKVAAIANQSKRVISSVSSGVHAGSKGAGAASLQGDALDEAWQKVSDLPAPAGLAGAKENLVSGLFIGKTAVANLSGGLQTAAPPSANETLARMSEATMLINKGLASITKMQTDLEKMSSRKKLAAKPAR